MKNFISFILQALIEAALFVGLCTACAIGFVEIFRH